MKKIIGILLFAFLALNVNSACAVDEFLTGKPAGSDNISLIDDFIEDNNIALLRGLSHNQRGAFIVYASASTLTVQVGEVFCSNATATITHTRANTSATTVTWANIDTGSEANSTTYYVYAVGDADQATFTCSISLSSSIPSGVTYYKRLGSFYNNASGNIEQITNDQIVGAVPSGAIVMWHGLIANIPSGWVLCDGTNSTPDLREKFIRGAAASTQAGGTGGSDTHTLTTAELAPHAHSTSWSGYSEIGADDDKMANGGASVESSFSLSTNSTGSGAAHNNIPAYYAILFIMKQ